MNDSRINITTPNFTFTWIPNQTTFKVRHYTPQKGSEATTIEISIHQEKPFYLMCYFSIDLGTPTPRVLVELASSDGYGDGPITILPDPNTDSEVFADLYLDNAISSTYISDTGNINQPNTSGRITIRAFGGSDEEGRSIWVVDTICIDDQFKPALGD